MRVANEAIARLAKQQQQTLLYNDDAVVSSPYHNTPKNIQNYSLNEAVFLTKLVMGRSKPKVRGSLTTSRSSRWRFITRNTLLTTKFPEKDEGVRKMGGWRQLTRTLSPNLFDLLLPSAPPSSHSLCLPFFATPLALSSSLCVIRSRGPSFTLLIQIYIIWTAQKCSSSKQSCANWKTNDAILRIYIWRKFNLNIRNTFWIQGGEFILLSGFTK